MRIRGFDSFTINDRLTLHLNPDALPRKVNCAAKVSQAVRSDNTLHKFSRMLARRSINHAMLTAFINRLICTESYVAVLAVRQSIRGVVPRIERVILDAYHDIKSPTAAPSRPSSWQSVTQLPHDPRFTFLLLEEASPPLARKNPPTKTSKQKCGNHG